MSRIDAITLRGIAVHGYHGVFPEERRDGQLFVVDVELQLVLETRSDSLSDTVNYGEIAVLEYQVAAEQLAVVHCTELHRGVEVLEFLMQLGIIVKQHLHCGERCVEEQLCRH